MTRNSSHNSSHRSKPWHIGNVLYSLDSFGQQVPAFNIKGESKVNTLPGGICTVLILWITLAFATRKAIVLSNHTDVDISTHIDKNAFPPTETVPVKDLGFKMAFTMQDFLTRELKNDPRYVKWFLMMYGKRNGEWFDEVIPYHECSVQELYDMGPVGENAQPILDVFIERELPLFCLDSYPEDMMLGGYRDEDTYYRLEFIMTPCNYIHRRAGYT